MCIVVYSPRSKKLIATISEVPLSTAGIRSSGLLLGLCRIIDAGIDFIFVFVTLWLSPLVCVVLRSVVAM